MNYRDALVEIENIIGSNEEEIVKFINIQFLLDEYDRQHGGAAL